ncbi:MAG: response regulator [Lachnospiraceae bacterium]|nr:response regulator [Lachnospiraceae bacterium]
MTDVADKYAQGDYSEKMTIDSKDEIGRLSRSLQTMAASLTDQVEVADEANRAKTAFLSNMSHEIRTPINAILGMNEMILRESSDKNTLTYSENIKMAGNTLLGLINDVLDFSKIEAGKIDIVPVDYDLSSVINDLVNMVRVRADEKALRLELDIDKNIPKLLNGDEVRIKQIITNMLTNAVKYTEKGSVTFKMGYERDAEFRDSIILKVSVKDTGIGIRKEDMEKLFIKFERIDEKRLRNVEGSGLGMSITRSLLEKMGSNLEVKSIYGEGSEFSFALCQKVVKWDPLGDYETAYSHNVNERKYSSSFTAKNAKVLMVDDNLMNLLVFKSLVKQTLVHTDTAESGDECLKLCDDIKYDIIFLDHMMPGKDGIETLHELKENKNGPNANTPIVCLTANAISGAREQYIREGFDDYLTKPIDTDTLEKVMLDLIPPEKIDHINIADDEILEFEAEGPDAKGENADEKADPERLEALEDQDMIDTVLGLKNCLYEDVYIEVLKTLKNTIDDSVSELERFKNEGDLKNYAIRVHSIKSTCRTIGAVSVGAKAQKLEDAGKSGDRAYINGGHDDFVSDCMKLKEIINCIV